MRFALSSFELGQESFLRLIESSSFEILAPSFFWQVFVSVVHLVNQFNKLTHNVFVLRLELIQHTRFLRSFDIFRFDGVFDVILEMADLRRMGTFNSSSLPPWVQLPFDICTIFLHAGYDNHS